MEGIGIGKGRNQVPTLFHRYRTLLQLIACDNISNNQWQRIHDPGRYPVLSDKDLVDLCFPTSQNQRRISRDLLPRAIRTLQSLEEAKELQIRGGTGRWQVLPPTPRTRAELE